jgi:hypothetical protein
MTARRAVYTACCPAPANDVQDPQRAQETLQRVARHRGHRHDGRRRPRAARHVAKRRRSRIYLGLEKSDAVDLINIAKSPRPVRT